MKLLKTKGSVAFIDDKQDFLNSMRRIFEFKYKVQTFSIAKEGLAAITTANEMLLVEERLLTEILAEENPDKLLRQAILWIVNPDREQVIETVFCDYEMPSVDGVTLLSSVANSRLHRVLLTGQAGLGEVVNAFNKNAIDHYLPKDDNYSAPALKQAALGANRQLDNSFRSDDPELLSVLKQPKVQERIESVFQDLSVVEYLFLPYPGGFLCKSGDQLAWIQLATLETANAFVEMLSEAGWNGMDLSPVIRRESLVAVEMMHVLGKPLVPETTLLSATQISQSPPCWLGIYNIKAEEIPST